MTCLNFFSRCFYIAFHRDFSVCSACCWCSSAFRLGGAGAWACLHRFPPDSCCAFDIILHIFQVNFFPSVRISFHLKMLWAYSISFWMQIWMQSFINQSPKAFRLGLMRRHNQRQAYLFKHVDKLSLRMAHQLPSLRSAFVVLQHSPICLHWIIDVWTKKKGRKRER